MSLKYFHIFFITTVLGLMTFICSWALQRRLMGESHTATLACGAVGLVLGLVYLGWFLRRYRSLP